MHSYNLSKKPKSTTEIIIDIPKEDVATAYKKSFAALLSDLTVEGFRKGKVPAEIGEKHLKKESIFSHLIQSLVPKIYEEIVKKESLKPIIQPKLELIKAKENEDWQIKATVAEKPIIDLSSYKKIVEKAKGTAKTSEIWTPGKEPTQTEESKEKQKHSVLNAVLDGLLKELVIEIPDMILEVERENRLTQLIDDVRKVGLSTEAYLKSKNITLDELKKRYTKEIEDTYKLEFLLGDIAEKEGIKVEKEDMEKLFASIRTDAERKQAEKNSYFYASIVRKQKVLDFITSL